MPYQIRHYDVLSTIEQDNESSTYLMMTPEPSKQKVVVKVFHKPAILSLDKREKFLQKIDALMRLKHTHIVPIIDGYIEKGNAYVVSSYIGGGSLQTRLERTSPQRLPFEEALSIVSQVGQALVYLHAQTLVHGHLMPKHILCDITGRAFISDLYSPDQSTYSEQKISLTSLRYLAPEQCQEDSSDQTTALSDQYALCCIAYELFTGQVPFTATDSAELKEQQLNMRPEPLSSIVADLPTSVNEAILKGLEKDPAQRYASITALLATLQTLSQATTHLNIPIIAAGQTSTLPKSPSISAAQSSAPLPEYDRPIPGSITRAASQRFATLWHSIKTDSSRRQKKVWLGSALLTMLCCLLVYITFAIYSPPVVLTHGKANLQEVAATQTVHAQPTTTPINIAALHPLPSATAKPRMYPTPTPQPLPTQAPTPTPAPTKSIAPTPLFTGQLSTQTGWRGTSSTNFISQLTIENVRIEADIRISGNGGGIAFRSDPNNPSLGYRFFIGTNGSYELLAASRALAFGSSSAIKTGNNTSNHITIVAIGNNIVIAVNEQNVVKISNSSYNTGSIGVIAFTFFYQTTFTTCSFSIYAE